MKTKLLKYYRTESKKRIGVFVNYETNTYMVVFDRKIFNPNLTNFKIKEVTDNFQVLDTDIKTLAEAKELCDTYRRKWILREISIKKFKHENRVY